MTLPRSRPDATEYPSFYAGYVASVPEGDLFAVLGAASDELNATLAAIPDSRGSYSYGEGKWTVCTLLGHVIDAERIFTYRMLRLARGDSTPLPGFDENTFAARAESDARTVADLTREMRVVRASTVALFASLPDAAWTRSGIVNERPVSVRALAYITIGHAQHHVGVLRERYGLTD